MEPVGEKEGLGDVAYGGKTVQPEDGSDPGGKDDAHQRAGDFGVPLFRPDDHDDHHQQPDEDGGKIRAEAQTAVGGELC